MWRGVALDVDGTLLHDTEAIHGAREFLNALDTSHTPYVIVSNTGVKTPELVAAKLCEAGLIIPVDRICTAAAHVAFRVKALCNDPFAERILIASDLPFEAWKALFEMDHPKIRPLCNDVHVHDNEGKTFVVLFSDGKLLELSEMLNATIALLHNGATLWATSRDGSVVRERQGRRVPTIGPGAFVAALEAAVPTSRIVCFGKGGNNGRDASALLHEAMGVLRNHGFQGTTRDVVVIGDRFDTDVRGGSAARMQTCLVETGCHAANEQERFPSDVAGIVATSLSDLVPFIIADRSMVLHRWRFYVQSFIRDTALQTAARGNRAVGRFISERASTLLRHPPRVSSDGALSDLLWKGREIPE